MVNVRSRLRPAVTPPSGFGRESVDGLARLGRDLSRTTDLPARLAILVTAIADVAEFGCVAINLVNDEGDLSVVAVSGPPDLEAALLGTVGSRASWDREIALADRHGAVHLSLSSQSTLDDMPVWVSDDESWFARTADHPQAWRPEYALYVPMFEAGGDLLGVVCVDLPTSGLMPEPAQLATLEVLARQAESAIIAARTIARAAFDDTVFASVFEMSGSAMCIADDTGRLTQTNRRFREVFGAVADVSAFDRLVNQVRGADSLTHEVRAAFDQPADERTLVVGAGIPDERSWFRVSVRSIGDGGSAVCTLTDITDERRVERQVDHDAERDALTGLPNRRGVRSAAATVIGACAPGDFLVTMFCDLDGFTRVNDQQGHGFGDQVLVDVAASLRAAVPETAVLGRVGGDEFVVFATCSSIRDAEELADTLVSAGAVPLPGGSGATLTTSVGMAMDDSQPHRSISELMQAADEALYRARLAGGGRWTSAPIL